MQKVRTRIAPSPTGYAHIGTVYQALFNYAYAKKYLGSFIVRIEDTDQSRFVDDAETFIFNSLDWVSLTENESPRKGGEFGPYRQSERLSLYHEYVEQLLRDDHAYFSYFPKKDAGQKKDYSQGKVETIAETSETPPVSIQEMIKRGDWIVRMRVPKEGTITVKDEIRGEIIFPVSEVTEQVLIKSDGFPTYHLAVVVDDHLMQISHILRAEEWLSSLPKHVLLYKYFSWDMPPVYHTATLRNPDKSKLSKRHGHTNALWYKEEGYLPEAVLNYLAHLGWSHPDEKDIFSLEEFISLFELKDIRPIAAVFDVTKLTWMNQQYIMNQNNGALRKLLLEYYMEDHELHDLLETHSYIDYILDLVKTRMKTLKEFKALVMPIIAAPDTSLLSAEHREIAPRVKELLSEIPDEEWNHENIFGKLKNVLDEKSVKMPVLYVLFTGNKQGLPLPELLEIMLRKGALERLDTIME